MEHESTDTAFEAAPSPAVAPSAPVPSAMDVPRASKPATSPSLGGRALTALKRVHEQLQGLELALFKRFELSAPQYSVLRVLRDADGGSLSCGEISRRLIHRVPDVTRLVDRLQKSDLVTRNRRAGDARVVEVRITQKAIDLLEALDQPVHDLETEALAPLDEQDLGTLLDLLNRLAPPPRSSSGH